MLRPSDDGAGGGDPVEGLLGLGVEEERRLLAVDMAGIFLVQVKKMVNPTAHYYYHDYCCLQILNSNHILKLHTEEST